MLQDVVSGVSGALCKLVRSTGESKQPCCTSGARGSGFAAQLCSLPAGPRSRRARPPRQRRLNVATV